MRATALSAALTPILAANRSRTTPAFVALVSTTQTLIPRGTAVFAGSVAAISFLH